MDSGFPGLFESEQRTIVHAVMVHLEVISLGTGLAPSPSRVLPGARAQAWAQGQANMDHQGLMSHLRPPLNLL